MMNEKTIFSNTQNEDEILSSKEEEITTSPEDEALNSEEATPAVNKLEEDYLKLKDDYIRLYAEMENMKKRQAQETEKTIKFATSSFAKELLGVKDNLERAISAMANAPENCQSLLEGVKLTEAELLRVFEKFGIKPFSHLSQKFDPNYERVVQEIEDPKSESGTILSELQRGYTIHDRILREAMVIVAK